MQPVSLFIRQYSKLITAGAIALAILILAGRWALSPAQATPTPAADAEFTDMLPALDTEPTIEAEPTAAPMLVVYISGAVFSPDVYQLPANARIKDLVLAAGGLTSDADAEHINLAEPVNDGQHVHVPRVGEPASNDAGISATNTETGAQNNGTIDINTASAAQLDELEGIGQVLAQRIIEYRTTNGSFKSVDELASVKGISANLLGKIASQLRAGP